MLANSKNFWSVQGLFCFLNNITCLKQESIEDVTYVNELHKLKRKNKDSRANGNDIGPTLTQCHIQLPSTVVKKKNVSAILKSI